MDDGEGSGANQSSINSTILNYYKKFGKKRDLEQYFSLSTAQGDVRDPTGMFWKQIKSQSDSSDSGGKRSDSSQELCRISIQCSIPEPSSSQEENTKTKGSVSPPIIIEELSGDVLSRTHSRSMEDDSEKSDDNHSQKSLDILLDTSMNKPFSPTSSVTSQRKLEWDSLADVGYANESDRKNSASSLSTLEKLALKQQYSNNDTDKDLGPPTAQSTPLDNNGNEKSKKGKGKKTRFVKKNTDYVELNVPQTSNASQGINVNLTKHISFSVAKNGAINIDEYNDVKTPAEKISVETNMTPQYRIDKEIQTSLLKTKETQSETSVIPQNQRIPVLIRLNSLRRRNRRRKIKIARKRSKTKKRVHLEDNVTPVQDRSGEQLSEAESFEYMPGHVYNQNQMNVQQNKPTNSGNKSSLESSGITTDSSKISKLSFTKDLEKSIELLKATCKQDCEDKDRKKKLIKEIIKRLLTTQYRDDESSTDFLSGLSLNKSKTGIRDANNTTTSTSDSNKTSNQPKASRPKKSILRNETFNANALASTSQSAPNLPAAITIDKIKSNLLKQLTSSNTDSESSREKTSSDAFAKTSSEELYVKYLEALKREQAYKKHLKDKELFLKQKLASTESVVKVPVKANSRVNNRLKDLIKDLTRNNYDDGSGDANKLEGSPFSNASSEIPIPTRSQRSHSVFTLSSGNSEAQTKKPNLKKKLQHDIKELSKGEHYCCCPHHSAHFEVDVADSSVQVNIKDVENEKPKKHSTLCENCKCPKESPRNRTKVTPNITTGDFKHVCQCDEPGYPQETRGNYLVYKCSRMVNKGVQLGDSLPRNKPEVGTSKTDIIGYQNDAPYESASSKEGYKNNTNSRVMDNSSFENLNLRRSSKSSQTNLMLKMLRQKSSEGSSESPRLTCNQTNNAQIHKPKISIREATRCIQTEISINPQISDPSLSDINIVNDLDCVKFISERTKEISRRSTKTDTSCKKYATNENTQQINEVASENNSNNVIETPKHNVSTQNIEQAKLNNFQDVQALDSGRSSENFTIPIQGTNMTLMVSIGSKDTPPVIAKMPEENKSDVTRSKDAVTMIVNTSEEGESAVTRYKDTLKMVAKMPEEHKSVVTEKKCAVDQCTSISEECSKGIQHDSKNDSGRNDFNEGVDHNSNTVNRDTNEKGKTNTHIDVGRIEFNTIPKRSPIEKRKLLRSNTDTGVLGNSNIQTEEILQRDKMTQQGIPLTASHNVECESNDERSQFDNANLVKESTDQCCRSKNQSKTKNEEVQNTGDNLQAQNQGKRNSVLEPVVGSTCSTSCRNYDKGKVAEQDRNENQPVQETSSRELESNSSGTKKSIIDEELCKSRKSSSTSERQCGSDPILDMIKNITRRYSKDDMEKNKRKKCFKEIVTVLNYLLDTDDSTDREQVKTCDSCMTDAKSEPCSNKPVTVSEYCQTREVVDRGVQLSSKKSKKRLCSTDSSELPTSTDLPATSSDSATCKVLNRIKKECEKFHQKRCKSHSTVKKGEGSSSTSANCDQCRHAHQNSCRSHKCKGHRNKTKPDKKSVAYNLIIQTSESMISEDVCENTGRPLKNIIVRVPSTRNCNVPFKEMEAKIEKRMPDCSPRCNPRTHRSRSLPNESEISTLDEQIRRSQVCSVRDYLELNRPDFVQKSSQRQNCLKIIRESRENERATHRDLLSMHVEQLPLNVTELKELRRIARHLGVDPNAKKHEPKLISEKEMKKHSEKIYKSLPEVVEKKEKLKKESVKKTNLLMANIFRKNLQKKTLRGNVNLSHYSTVIKI